MANTTTHGKGTMTITGLDADWSYITDGGFTEGVGLKVSSIQFLPSAANDIMIIHDDGVDGADIMNTGPTGGTAPIFKNFDPPQWKLPIIDISDCTFTTAASAKVIIDYV